MTLKSPDISEQLLSYLTWQHQLTPFHIESEILHSLRSALTLHSPHPSSDLSKHTPSSAPETSTVLPPENNSIESLAQQVKLCSNCRLAATRSNHVFGEGNINARLMFIGEGPGHDEDVSGRPFVGKAGQLLTKIIESGLKIQRDEVYIANIVKCRPPNNRDPLPDEAETCKHFVEKQIALIKPEAIILLGRIALKYLLNIETSIKAAREMDLSYNGIKVFVTYHPSALLRNEELKRPTWEDMKKVIKYLNLFEVK